MGAGLETKHVIVTDCRDLGMRDRRRFLGHRLQRGICPEPVNCAAPRNRKGRRDRPVEGSTRVPPGFEPGMADLQSAALAAWLRRLMNVRLAATMTYDNHMPAGEPVARKRPNTRDSIGVTAACQLTAYPKTQVGPSHGSRSGAAALAAILLLAAYSPFCRKQGTLSQPSMREILAALGILSHVGPTWVFG